MNRQDIAERLTGDQGQGLRALSWWPAVDQALEDPGVRVVVLWMSRQTGKTQKLMERGIGDLLLVPNSYILFLSAGLEQAETIYNRKLREPLRRLLRGAGVPASTIRMTKRGVENARLNSEFSIIAPTEDTTPARTVTLLIIDEGRYVSDRVFAALAPSVISTGGKILVASSAGQPTGFFYDLATSSEDPEIRVIRVDGNENPYADPRVLSFLGRLLRRILPSAAAQDLDNVFAAEGGEFLPWSLIDAAVDPMWRETERSQAEAFAAVDLSRRRDRTTVIVVTREAARQPEAPDHLQVASLAVWDPAQSPTGEVDLAGVRAHLATLPTRFPNLVGLDVDEGSEGGSVPPWARSQPGLVTKIKGVAASVDSNMQMWSSLAARLHGRTLTLPPNERLVAELRGLRQESVMFGSKWRIVDASRKYHRDISAALAMAVHAAGEQSESAFERILAGLGRGRPAPPAGSLEAQRRQAEEDTRTEQQKAAAAKREKDLAAHAAWVEGQKRAEEELQADIEHQRELDRRDAERVWRAGPWTNW